MNHLRFLPKKLILAALPSCLLFSCAVRSVDRSVAAEISTDSIAQVLPSAVNPAHALPSSKKKIKIALLLDTSNSMDGLIDQARAQLWKLVNELSLAKCQNEKPELELALYEYGNDRLSSYSGFVRQVSSFTGDLDLISEQLFSLKTSGGEEYCGEVISLAAQQLEWKKDSMNLQLIFIAGNESFYQGRTDATQSCNSSKEKDIVVNTIFCGEYNEGLKLGWKSAALLTEGDYMCIEQNKKTIYIETPYDNEIAQMNDQLNATYVSYGSRGYEKKMNQVKQDDNAKSYGAANTTNRVISKSSKFYSNASWDLVDASKRKDFDVSKIKEQELPKELKGKTIPQKQQFIAQKTKEREDIVKQIEVLNLKRNAFIAEKSKTMDLDQSLDAAMIKAIRAQAAKKNFVFEI